MDAVSKSVQMFSKISWSYTVINASVVLGEAFFVEEMIDTGYKDPLLVKRQRVPNCALPSPKFTINITPFIPKAQ